MEHTPTQALATVKLGEDVVAWAIQRRNSRKPELSFRIIARELEALTGVAVTDETVRLWCLSAKAPAEAAS